MIKTSAIDLTQGPVLKNLIRLSSPILFGMVVFTFYLMADLYFVSRLGADAVAAVSICSNAIFIILGLSFILGTGAMALIAQAFGKRDYGQAGMVFQQSLILTMIVGASTSLLGLALAPSYVRFFGGTGISLEWGVAYFRIFSISFFFMLLIHVVQSCYRGMGDTKLPMVIVLQSTALNVILDPILIFGLLGIPPLGVRGAAIASLLAQIYALGRYAYLIFAKGTHVKIDRPWRLDPGLIRKSLSIGVPSGLTYFLLAFNMLITYRIVSTYGTQALASLGIGFRILQSIYLPVIALASGMAALVGQNFGAGLHQRVTRTLLTGWALSMAIMLGGTLLCLLAPSSLVAIFSSDPGVLHYGVVYLTIMSLGNVVVGTIMAVSAVFQGLGKTYPTLVAAVTDNLLFALLVLTLPPLFGWGIQAVWWIKLLTAALEMILVAAWLTREIRRSHFLLPYEQPIPARIHLGGSRPGDPARISENDPAHRV